uniref:3-dehydroquinate synthase n=1 Tax=Candidatus Planktophila sp. TaxID=2175601 RepID=UPI00404A4D3A
MSTVNVSGDRHYQVLIDVNWKSELSRLLIGRTRAALIVSENMKERVGEVSGGDVEIFTFPIPDGEAGKSTATLQQVWNWLGAAGFTRDDLVIAIGGGATTDFGGYAAASWLRGIDWVAIPTTVAGMVDAAIGGKTAINSDYGKNLIGAFHSPIAVLIDFTWLETLSDRDYAAGLAEVVKAGFIADGEILNQLRGRDLSSIRSDQSCVLDIVTRAISVKALVVSEDFKESFAREALNYGHTLGHAIELESKFAIRHGECVSIGMAFMAHLQLSLGLISPQLAQDHLDILHGLGLPISYNRSAWPRLLANMSLDKKARGKSLRFVTITSIGKTERLENPDETLLLAAYEKVSS